MADQENADRVRASVALLEHADYCLRETMAKIGGLPVTKGVEKLYLKASDIETDIRTLQRDIRATLEQYL